MNNEDNVVNIFPANDFKVVAENASKEMEMGVIIGYNKEGGLDIWGGGLTSQGKQPTNAEWLWLIEYFKNKLLNGDYE